MTERAGCEPSGRGSRRTPLGVVGHRRSRPARPGDRPRRRVLRRPVPRPGRALPRARRPSPSPGVHADAGGWGVAGLALVAHATAYPAFEALSGLSYPRHPTFAVPCPGVIVTAGFRPWLRARESAPACRGDAAVGHDRGSPGSSWASRPALALPASGGVLLVRVLRLAPATPRDGLSQRVRSRSVSIWSTTSSNCHDNVIDWSSASPDNRRPRRQVNASPTAREDSRGPRAAGAGRPSRPASRIGSCGRARRRTMFVLRPRRPAAEPWVWCDP